MQQATQEGTVTIMWWKSKGSYWLRQIQEFLIVLCTANHPHTYFCTQMLFCYTWKVTSGNKRTQQRELRMCMNYVQVQRSPASRSGRRARRPPESPPRSPGSPATQGGRGRKAHLPGDRKPFPTRRIALHAREGMRRRGGNPRWSHWRPL